MELRTRQGGKVREKEKEVRLGYVRKETIKKTTPSYERKSKPSQKPKPKACTACIAFALHLHILP
jgi:hypothetical protein